MVKPLLLALNIPTLYDVVDGRATLVATVAPQLLPFITPSAQAALVAGLKDALQAMQPLAQMVGAAEPWEIPGGNPQARCAWIFMVFLVHRVLCEMPCPLSHRHSGF